MFEYSDNSKSCVDINVLMVALTGTLAQLRKKKRKTNIVHVGAFNGELSVRLADSLPKSRVFAIEPCLSSFKKLKKTIENHPNISAHHCCIGAWHQDTIILYTNTSLQGNSLYKEFTKSKGSKLRDEIVYCHTMQSFMDENKIKHVDLLRINCEGGEFKVFDKGSDWLENINVVAVALHGKAQCFLTEEAVKKKIYIASRLERNHFQQMYGFVFNKNMKHVPTRHIWQIWIKQPKFRK